MSQQDLVDKIMAAPEWEPNMWQDLKNMLGHPVMRAALALCLEEAVMQERAAGTLDFTQPNATLKASHCQGVAFGLRRAIDLLTEYSTPKEDSSDAE